MRARKGSARNRAKKRLFKEAKGGFGARSRLLKTVKQSVVRSRVYAYRDRKVRKREFRRLWILRINAACRERDLRYSEFIHGLVEARVTLDRKSLSELAIHDAAAFDALVRLAREHLAVPVGAA